jgi:hypothetical protein
MRMRSIRLPTVSQALVALAIFVCLTFPASLVSNAVTGWIDEQIASYFGWTSPTAIQIVLFIWHWIVPFVAAIAILIGYHFWYTRTASADNAKADAIQRINVDPVIAGGVFLVVIGLIIFAVRISNLSTTPRITSGFFFSGDPPSPPPPQLLPDDGGPVKWYPGYLLGAGGNDKGVFFSTFQATGKNSSDEFLGPLSGYVRSEITGKQFPLISTDGPREMPIEGSGIPAGNQFHIAARLTDTAMASNEFLRDFGRLTFVFQYGNHVYIKRFSPQEIQTEVRQTEANLTPKPPQSVVGLKPMPSSDNK